MVAEVRARIEAARPKPSLEPPAAAGGGETAAPAQ
jgi:hypothetical protein